MIIEKIYLKERFPELGQGGYDSYVDCYIPSTMENAGDEMKVKKYPCMVVCPGGGYHFTSDREAEPIALHFVSEGYRVVVVRYSYQPHPFPQQLREVAAAMEVVYQNAEEWKIDVSRVAMIGFSAGGHLVAQYSNRYDCPEVREVFPESKPVQAAILSYPVITDDPMYKHAKSIQNYLGYEPEGRNEKDCANECIVSEKTPPTFIWHTVEDKTVPVQNSILYAKALADCKVPFEMHIYPFGPHGLSTVDGVVYETEKEPKVQRVRRWLEDAKTWLKMMGV